MKSNNLVKLIVLGCILFFVFMVFIAPNVDNLGDIVNLINPVSIKADEVTLDSEQGITSLYAIVKTEVDTEWIEIRLELMDENDRVIKTETKKFDDLEADLEYKFKFSMSLSEALSARTYRFVFVDGRRA